MVDEDFAEFGGFRGIKASDKAEAMLVRFDNLWFEKVWIYLFILLLLLLFYLWVFWLVGLIGFAWFCAFMVQMWVFELGGGVQYSCDYEVWLLCSGVGMNCSDVGRKRETDRARGRREI